MKSTKTSQRRAVARAEKLIKVPPEVHRQLKIKAAERGQSIGRFVGELVRGA